MHRRVGQASLAGVFLAIVGLAATLASCTSKPATAGAHALSQADLMDPSQCTTCHGDHAREWSGSMHAYASDDPIFVAMNARGQRETDQKLGTFCVQCHAPMAVRTGATTNGLNLASLPRSMHGVTCFFCHSTDAVNGAHDNPLHTADDGVLRAALGDPIETDAHATKYSALHDRERIDSAQLCGSCHDVKNQKGATIESTYAEWQGTLYAHDTPTQLLTCSSCHMQGSNAQAANLPNAPTRLVHDHSMPGVDLALTAFPETDAQRVLVQQNLDSALVAKLCVKPPQAGDTVDVTLDNAFVGHAWPSGAAQDRRAWIELVAYANGQVVFSSGVVPDAQSVTTLNDPALWLLRETMADDQGNDVRMMWQAAKATAAFLPPAVTNDPKSSQYYHAVTKSFAVPASADRITMRVRFIPVGYDVLDDLIASGDLDPSYRAKMPVFALAGTQLEWTRAMGFVCVP